jgi:hypothetical protein
MKSALVVLRSLNVNAKGIMAILIKHQLASSQALVIFFLKKKNCCMRPRATEEAHQASARLFARTVNFFFLKKKLL